MYKHSSLRAELKESMRSFLAIAIITLAASLSASAQEHTPRPPASSPSATPRSPSLPVGANTVTEDSSGWIRYSNVQGRFSVLMPEVPKAEDPKTTPSPHGPYTTYLFITRTAGTIYLIGWVDYAPTFNFIPHQELEANRDNFVTGVNATLMDSRPLTIDGYQAIEFIAESPERRFKSRVFMVGRRPYQIVIVSTKETDDPVSTSRFFNSFKVSRN